MSFERYLIEAVKKQPVLYDRKHTKYNNKPDVETAWANVCNAVNKHFDNIHVNHCKLRWRSLRDRYVKQIEKTAEGTFRTPEAKKWIYTSQLDFLLQHLHKRKYDINQLDYNGTPLHNVHIKNETPSSPQSPHTFSFIETNNMRNLESTTTLEFLNENEYAEYDEVEQETENIIPIKEDKKLEIAEYDELEFTSVDDIPNESRDENQIDKLLRTLDSMMQLQLKRDAERSANEAYFKVLDSYFSKLPAKKLDEAKVEILNLVLAKI